VDTVAHHSALLTPPQASERLQVSLSTVRRLVAAGDLRAVRVGGQLRIDPDDLRRFLAEHRTAA
jgi:excisionase family DNA binding protein